MTEMITGRIGEMGLVQLADPVSVVIPKSARWWKYGNGDEGSYVPQMMQVVSAVKAISSGGGVRIEIDDGSADCTFVFCHQPYPSCPALLDVFCKLGRGLWEIIGDDWFELSADFSGIELEGVLNVIEDRS